MGMSYVSIQQTISFKYAEFQLLAVHLHIGRFWGHVIPTVYIVDHYGLLFYQSAVLP